jgi:serine protease Do
VLRSRKKRQRSKDTVPALIFLSGPGRGQISRLEAKTVHLLKTASGNIVVAVEPDQPDSILLARLHLNDETYEVEVKRNTQLRLNGSQILNAVLNAGDMLEIEEPPALLRFDFVHRDGGSSVDLDTLFNDCFNVTLHQSQTKVGFLARLPFNFVRDLTVRTTRLFRIGFTIAVILLTVILVSTIYSLIQVKQQQQQDREAIVALGDWFREREPGFISRQELNQLKNDIKKGIDTTQQRVDDLEFRSHSASRVIGAASQAVVFLQGAYIYAEESTGRPVRYAVTPEGHPFLTREGTPLTTLDGNGPIARRQFIGTAFVVSADGLIMTNRHVALPWENDGELSVLKERGIFPQVDKFVGFLPHAKQSFDVTLVKASDTADLAVLRTSEAIVDIAHILLSETDSSPGEEVYVLGYPTGLKALLARTSEAFLTQMREGKMDFWKIANRLADAGYMLPLANRGIVGQVSDSAIVYDADTTRGGSGGPVLNSSGKLVAVNAAILSEYGGANIGIPVEQVRQLLSLL